jgi:hypothetical protein
MGLWKIWHPKYGVVYDELEAMVVYLSPADNSPRLTRRLSQGLKVLDEWALMTSQQPSKPW